MGQHFVGVATLGAGADVHRRADEIRDGMEEPMVRVGGDRVRGHDVQSAVDDDDDAGFGPQSMSDPPEPDLLHVADSVRLAEGRGRGRGEPRVHGVHQPAVDVSGGIAQHEEDCHGDQQADQGVCDREPEHHSEGSEHDGKGGEPVRACVETVRDEGGRADLPSDPDPVQRDQFVAGEFR